MNQRFAFFLGAMVVVLSILYGSVMEDSAACYRVIGCPQVRQILYAR